MKLNHINLIVTDVIAASTFLQTWFGLSSLGGNAGMDVLLDDSGLVLTIMKAGRNVLVDYPGHFHVGFFIEEDDQVDDLNLRMREAGIDVSPPERHHTYGFCVDAPGEFFNRNQFVTRGRTPKTTGT